MNIQLKHRKPLIIVAVSLLVVLTGIVVFAFINRDHGVETGAGTIGNKPSHSETQQPAPSETPADGEGSVAPGNAGGENTSGKIDQNIVKIQDIFDKYFNGLWLDTLGDRMSEELKPLGVNFKRDDIPFDGRAMFGVSDSTVVVGGWISEPFKCELSTTVPDRYECTVWGDWAKQRAGHISHWDDQLKQIQRFCAENLHGAGGSAREMQHMTWLIDMDKAHNTGRLWMERNDYEYRLGGYDYEKGEIKR